MRIPSFPASARRSPALLRLLLPCALLAAVIATPARPLQARDARPMPWPKVIKHVLPTDAERAEKGIAWRPTLWDAVVEANKVRKPILLWAMNGHPLGCT